MELWEEDLRFIKAFQERNGRSPTIAEIGEHFHRDVKYVKRDLEAYKAWKYIRREGREIVILKDLRDD